MSRCYRQRSVPCNRRCRRSKEKGRGVGSLLKLANKIIKNPLVKNLGKMALKELPGVYEKGVKNLKIKK